MKKDFKTGFTLLELLVVMAIIGVLVGLILPTIFRMKTRARILEARSDVRQLSIAWNEYLLDYHKFPGISIKDAGPEAMAILRGDNFGVGLTNNPRGFSYMDFRSSTSNFCDPWGVPGTAVGVYHIVLDTDYDNQVTHPKTGDVIPLHVIVWSDGPDGDSGGTDDDVNSWTEGR